MILENAHIEDAHLLTQISASEFHKLQKWVNQYIAHFYKGNPRDRKQFALKQAHTQRVVKEITLLGHALGLAQHAFSFMRTVALLHDIGRFEQFARYHTFLDQESVNHAALGLEILKQEGVLDSYPIYAQKVISKVIQFHNYYELPSIEDLSIRFFSRLLRDADKLDIWWVVLSNYRCKNGKENKAINLGFPDEGPISPGVTEALMLHRPVHLTDVANQHDLKLLQVSWIYDLNFQPTVAQVKERCYLDQLFSLLPKDQSIDQIQHVAFTYLDRRLR